MTTTDIDGDQPGGSLANGSSSDDRVSGATDPDELRAQLALAQDRLSFYEGFDRVITENVRRSGELMLEMLAMRESMTASADRETRGERQRIGASLTELDSGLQAIRTQIDAIAGQVTSLRHSLGSEPARRPEYQPAPPAPEAASAAPAAPVSSVAGWNAPQVIDVVVHQVSRATIALSLQRYLGNLDSVAGVEAREFAEGVLRMQVTAHQPLTVGGLSGWTEGGPFTVLQMQPNVVELTLAGGA
ncbi:MAG: hypothetical protein M3457_14455 [Chloroflexota bacterium]|nr:hypothetical protein [Chloroflexota bacterium]